MELLAPNGKPSNLNPEQYRLVRTPAFKNWFGDWEKAYETGNYDNVSKIIDEKTKEPLVVYHGSDKMEDIVVFKSIKGHDYNFFSADRGESGRYIIDYESVYPNEKYNQSLRKKYYESKIKPFFINSLNFFDYNKLSINEKNDLNLFLENNKDELINTIIKFSKDIGYKSLEDYFDDVYSSFNSTSEIEILNIFLRYSSDDWWILETSVFQKYIKSNNYDAFTTKESGNWNIAVYNSKNIKLADGTNTTFDGSNPDIRFDDGGNIEEGGGGIDYIDSVKTYFDGNKNVVYSTKDYKIAVDDVNNARYITLWFVNSLFDLDVKVGSLALYKTEDDFLKVQEIDIQKSHRGKGMATKMYLMALKYSSDNIKGIKSYLPDRVNKKQIPKIYKRLNGKIEGDWAYIYKSNNIYANGGEITFTTEQVENKLGRKLHWWNDDVVSINGIEYKKVFLRPEYKRL